MEPIPRSNHPPDDPLPRVESSPIIQKNKLSIENEVMPRCRYTPGVVPTAALNTRYTQLYSLKTHTYSRASEIGARERESDIGKEERESPLHGVTMGPRKFKCINPGKRAVYIAGRFYDRAVS